MGLDVTLEVLNAGVRLVASGLVALQGRSEVSGERSELMRRGGRGDTHRVDSGGGWRTCCCGSWWCWLWLMHLHIGHGGVWSVARLEVGGRGGEPAAAPAGLGLRLAPPPRVGGTSPPRPARECGRALQRSLEQTSSSGRGVRTAVLAASARRRRCGEARPRRTRSPALSLACLQAQVGHGRAPKPRIAAHKSYARAEEESETAQEHESRPLDRLNSSHEPHRVARSRRRCRGCSRY